MRWFFGLLLLANAGVLMWGAWYRESAAPGNEARPDINAGGMRLLDEPGVVLEPRTHAKPAPTARAEPAEAAQCYHIGPFTAAEQSMAVAKQLGALNVPYREREVQTREEAGQRIFLPGFRSQKAAEARRAELARLGIKDHALVTEPNKSISVALGIFSQTEGAQARLQELKKKGIKPQVETFYRTVGRRWLETGPLEIELRDRLKKALGAQPGVELQPTPCPEPAAPAKADTTGA